MLPPETFLAFAAAAFLLSLAPGPDNIFVLTQSAMTGARSGVIIVLGLCSGLVFHSAAVAFGLAALIKASVVAFTVMKFAGAGYLLYLAYRAFRAPVQDIDGGAVRLPDGALFRRGLIMNITNPKVAIFFLAFFPQFIDPARGAIMLQTAQLGLVFVVVALVVFCGIALVAGRLSRFLRASHRAQLTINRVAGLVFVGLAAKVALGTR